MKTYTTQFEAINPDTGKLCLWAGDNIQAPSFEQAESICRQKAGYLKVVGELVEEVDQHPVQTKALSASDTRIARAHAREHKKYVAMTRRIYQAALKKQCQRVISALDKHTVQWVENNLDDLVSSRPIYQAFRQAYLLIALEAGQTVLDELRTQIEQKAGIFDASFYSGIWKRIVQAFVLENAGDHITGITNTTRNRIRFEIANSIEEGEGAYDRAKAIQNRLQSNDFTFERSLSIARTEGTTAASLGHQTAADSLSDRLNMAMGKKWIPVHDNRTRHTHLAMEKYPQIPKDRSFLVGGENMAYPGDQSASARNVINCRCRASYSVLRDSNGRIIPKDSLLVAAYA